MAMKPCLICGRPSPTSRCADHQRAKASPSQRGYGADHQRQTREAIAAEGWCHTLGGCPYPDSGTPANPLTGGHPLTVEQCGGDRQRWAAQPRVPQCHRCNSGHRPIG